MSGPNYARVWNIYEMLTPKPKDLLDTNRFYVREGEIYVWDEKQKKKKKRYAFLFNDIMLLAKKEGSKRFWLRVFITLKSPFVNVEDVSSGMSFGFKLICRTRTFIFFTATPELNQQWMAEVHDSAKGNHDKRAAGENGTAAGPVSPTSTKRTTSSAGFSAEDPSGPRRPSRADIYQYDSSVAKDSISAQVSFDSGLKLDTLRPIDDPDDQVVPVLSPPPRSRTSSKGKQSSANLVVSPSASHKNSAPTSPSTGGGGSLLDDFIDFESESKQQEKAYRAQQQQTPAPVAANPFSMAATAPPVQTAPAMYAAPAPVQQPYGGGVAMTTSPQQMQYQMQMQQLALQQQQQQQMQLQMQMQQMSMSPPAANFNPFFGAPQAQPQPQPQAQPAMSPFFTGGSTLSPVMSAPSTSYSSTTTSTTSSTSKDPFAGLWEASKNNKPVTTAAAPSATNGTTATSTRLLATLCGISYRFQ
eukprot:TRINITY_DN12217_c0_g1_i1.p1 TRINITY_DN12217_c0_g1~~TRINITY_DN12217_c0_g1_i1.p1  ORF type:complete len:489 (+),score=129.28 TRINITY_DN12217_c0_g1_i1:57-1469(+)